MKSLILVIVSMLFFYYNTDCQKNQEIVQDVRYMQKNSKLYNNQHYNNNEGKRKGNIVIKNIDIIKMYETTCVIIAYLMIPDIINYHKMFFTTCFFYYSRLSCMAILIISCVCVYVRCKNILINFTL